MKKILVTGSSGYIGRRLVEKLHELNFSVIEYDASNGYDINDRFQLQEQLTKADIVVNLAGMGDLYDVMDDPVKGFLANVVSAETLGKACLAKGIELIHASTTCVYGDQRGRGTITEDSEPNPTEPYANQKLESERRLLELKNNGLKLTIARLGTVYGGDMRISQVIRRFILQNLRREPIVIHGTGNQERAYTHIDDIVDGLITLINHQRKETIYNICSEHSYSVNDLTLIIEKISGIPFEKIYIQERPGEFFVQPIKATHMMNEYSWQAKVSIQNGIRKSIELAAIEEIRNEVYSRVHIPCVHRIHDQPVEKLDAAHRVQAKLHFSIHRTELIKELLEMKEHTKNNERILVTFDDGYRDVLSMERFFDANPQFQPVIFYPTSLFSREPLWFDLFYSTISNLNVLDVRRICSKYNIEQIHDDPLVNLASSKIKEHLRRLLPKEQIKLMEDVFGYIIEPKFDSLYLQVKDLRRLIKKGWILGSHGKYHFELDLANADLLKLELLESLKSVLNLGGRAWLAYPDGKWSETVKRTAIDVGYKRLFTIDKTSSIICDPDHYYRQLIGYDTSSLPSI